MGPPLLDEHTTHTKRLTSAGKLTLLQKKLVMHSSWQSHRKPGPTLPAGPHALGTSQAGGVYVALPASPYALQREPGQLELAQGTQCRTAPSCSRQYRLGPHSPWQSHLPFLPTEDGGPHGPDGAAVIVATENGGPLGPGGAAVVMAAVSGSLARSSAPQSTAGNIGSTLGSTSIAPPKTPLAMVGLSLTASTAQRCPQRDTAGVSRGVCTAGRAPALDAGRDCREALQLTQRQRQKSLSALLRCCRRSPVSGGWFRIARARGDDMVPMRMGAGGQGARVT